jgi:alkylation response protein AidB-like acyl-CoA dehydrogenase
MDFAWTEEQQRFREELIRFGRRELNEDLVRRDADEEFPREAWKRCAALGIQGLPVPEEYGGGGADPLTIVAALEGLGYACRDNGLLF